MGQFTSLCLSLVTILDEWPITSVLDFLCLTYELIMTSYMRPKYTTLTLQELEIMKDRISFHCHTINSGRSIFRRRIFSGTRLTETLH